ncbi:bacillithiol system redox-active protein YtxJ [Paenibacillus sp. L3-i20]|uniref:bacillithiol system redox-active protein YtxJ n=1 Tax=Paenibacillus sp. L3-i20 TaxID=2905833 RepID=UPI001EE0EFDF|nr:bacillithiol system redox-active protein YtxJ [Paenibacillus sp. L3-i20]GKU77697.1 thioredoxin family protein [Paenibacillus sp. L3-i20]
MIHLIQTQAELNSVIAQSHHKPTIIFKHSTRCGTSSFVHAHMQQFAQQILAERLHIGMVMVRVIEERALSNEITRRFSITHQSPQALLLKGGQVIWHASHRQIESTAIRRVLAVSQ